MTGTGAGIYVQSASVTIRRSTINGNGLLHSTLSSMKCMRGGGINYLGGTRPASLGLIEANEIRLNGVQAGGSAAGVALKNMGSASRFSSNIIAQNLIELGGTGTGAGVLVEQSVMVSQIGSFLFNNNTIANNTNGATGGFGVGGGILFSGISQPFFVDNCIVWGNLASGDKVVASINVPPGAPLPLVSYSDLDSTVPVNPAGWIVGTNVISFDPLFVPVSGDYHIQNVAGQHLINAGTNAVINMTTAPTDIDIDNAPRITNFSTGGIVDIGADEI